MSQRITIIWLRHGRKLYDNNKGPEGCYQHDPALDIGAEKEIINRAESLIKTYGVPTHCVASPYRRARDTALWMISAIKGLDAPNVQIDANISEFLGHQKIYMDEKGILNNEPKAELDTLQFGPPTIGETYNQLFSRCQKHIELFELNPFALTVSAPYSKTKDEEKKEDTNQGMVVWVITHGVVISTIQAALRSTKSKLLLTKHKVIKTKPEPVSGIVLTGTIGNGLTLTKL